MYPSLTACGESQTMFLVIVNIQNVPKTKGHEFEFQNFQIKHGSCSAVYDFKGLHKSDICNFNCVVIFTGFKMLKPFTLE